MKTINYSLPIFIILVLLSSQACAPAENTPIEAPVNTQPVQPKLSPYEVNLIPEYRDRLEEFDDATKYSIDLFISDEVSEVTGQMEVLYTNTETITLNELYFRLFPNVGVDYLEVEKLKLNGQETDFSIEHEGTAIRVDLSDPLKPGESDTIEMDFSQNVPSVMGGNYGLYIYMDDILALDAFFPIIPVYDDEGWNVEDPPQNADMIFADASFFKVTVNAPADLVLAASGVELESKLENGRQVATFFGGPQRDFYLAASPRFTSESVRVGDTLVSSYFPPEYREMGLLVLTTGVRALELFSNEFGLYPYTELDLVSTPMRAGGMEYSGAAALALYLYEGDTTINGAPGSVFLESAAAHEVAHQWFFNQVMNDQIDEPWLDEGFAQYLTYRYYLGANGGSAAQSYLDSWEGRWSRIDFGEIPVGLPAAAYKPLEYSPIIYGRAPIFIRELEDAMGNETFGDFLRQYIDAYRWQEVDTQLFHSLAEQACACDLDPLFEKYGAFE